MSSIAFPPDDTTSSPSAHTSSTMDHGRSTMDQLRAARNRANARKSTGPKTPEGKSRSAQNARTHNLTSTTPPPSLLANPTYRQAKQELVDELRPTSPMQQVLVSQLAHLTWQLDQIPKLEHQILSATDLPGTEGSAHHEQPTDPNTLAALHLLENQPTPLTRLWDHHRRLLTRTQSLLRQLLHLQHHERTRQEDDAALEARLDRNQRAELLNAAHIAVRDAAFRARPAPADARETCQSAPNPANAHHPNAPAQNEPTPADPPPPSPKAASDAPSPPTEPAVGEGGGEGPSAQQGATPRNTAQQLHTQAQNEPTHPPLSLSPPPPLSSSPFVPS